MPHDKVKDMTTDQLRKELARCDASEALKLTYYRDAIVAELKRRVVVD